MHDSVARRPLARCPVDRGSEISCERFAILRSPTGHFLAFEGPTMIAGRLPQAAIAAALITFLSSLAPAAAAGPRVLVCVSDTQTGEAPALKARLTATGAFAQVDTFACDVS